MEQGCPNPDCPNYGRQKRCFKHCIYCGADILWKPKGMDFNVKYEGPKPLDPETGKKHICKEENVTEEGEDNLNKCKTNGYSYLLAYFLHHGYPSLGRHYTRCHHQGIGLSQECGDYRCVCMTLLKTWKWENPEVAAQWNKQRAEWLKEYGTPIDRSRFKRCLRCGNIFKVMSYSPINGWCSDCYWEVEMEKGIPYTPLGFG